MDHELMIWAKYYVHGQPVYEYMSTEKFMDEFGGPIRAAQHQYYDADKNHIEYLLNIFLADELPRKVTDTYIFAPMIELREFRALMAQYDDKKYVVTVHKRVNNKFKMPTEFDDQGRLLY